MKRHIKRRVKEICKEFDKRVKEAGVSTAGYELAVALAEAEASILKGEYRIEYISADEIRLTPLAQKPEK